MALDFLAGCVGGAAGIIVGHPLDTVKVRIQTQCSDNPKYRGTFHCLSSIAKQESIAGLYKGIASPLYGVAAVNAIIFGVYGVLKPMVVDAPGNNALWAHFMAGSASGAVQSVIASPMELVKTRMQLDESVTSSGKKGPSAWQVLRQIYQNEGGLCRGVFKGWGITLSREIPGLGAYFATYEALTRGEEEVSTLQMLMAGGTAGIMSWISCFPMDVVKTRLQSDTMGKYTGAIDCIRKTAATEGYRAFFKGLNSTVIRAFPTNAATFTVVTWIMRYAEQGASSGYVDNAKNLDLLWEKWEKLPRKMDEIWQLKAPQYHSYYQSMAKIRGVYHTNVLGGGQDPFIPGSSTFSCSSIKANGKENTKTTLLDHSGNIFLEGGGIPMAEAERESLIVTEGKILVEEQGNRSNGVEVANGRGNVLVMQEGSQTNLPGLNSEVKVMEKTGNQEVSGRIQAVLAPSMELNNNMVVLLEGPSQSNAIKITSNVNNFPSTIISPTTTTTASGGNSHETGSFPPDLSILAEILDLPVIILETSMDGKPLTLFNIVLTWLKQKTALGLCRCMYALDHCVCLSM